MTTDTSIEQVVLVSGKLLHRGTGRPIDGSVAVEAKEGPVACKLLEDGTFAVSGRPELLFPNLAAAAQPLHLTIHANSQEFRQPQVDHSISLTIAMAFPFDAPLDQGDVKLPVDPAAIPKNLARTIRGLVTEAMDPRPPILGATVEILQSGAVTDTTSTNAAGRFSFDDIVVLAPATIRCSAATFKTQTRQLLIDFHLSLHEELIRLEPV